MLWVSVCTLKSEAGNLLVRDASLQNSAQRLAPAGIGSSYVGPSQSDQSSLGHQRDAAEAMECDFQGLVRRDTAAPSLLSGTSH